MKICIVVNTFPSISETFILSKVSSLMQRGHKVEVVCFKQMRHTRDVFATFGIDGNSLVVRQIVLSKNIFSLISAVAANPFLLFKSLSYSFSSFKKKFQRYYYIWFLNKPQYDIIHFEFSGLGAFFLPIIDKLNAFTAVSCRGTAENVKLLNDAERQQQLRKLFSKVNLVHCVSEKMKTTIKPYCTDKTKIFVNRPAVDTGYFRPGKPADNGVFNIVSIGRLTFIKGYLIGLLAVKALVQKGLQVEWQIIGEGPDYNEMLFHMHVLGISNFVKLVGKRNREEVNEILSTANVLMLTSYSEGIPNVVLEAMSKEIPVVTTNCGGVEEVIDNGVDGFIIELYGHAALANKIEQLMSDKSLRENIGKAARKKIIEKFELQQQAEVFEKQYKLVV